MTDPRVPPHDLDAEAALLSSWMFAEPGVMEKSRVEPDAFYRSLHGDIARACVSLFDDGVLPEVRLVADRLRRDLGPEKYADVLAEFREVTTAVDTPVVAGEYASIVRRHARARRAAGLTNELLEGIHSGSLGLDEISARAQAIQEATQADDESIRGWASEWGDEVLEDLKSVRDWGDADASVVSWGIQGLDAVGCVIRPGAFPVVAGAPGSGKTTLLISWSFSTAQRVQRPVVFLSLEMHPTEIVRKAMLGRARIPDPQYQGVNEEYTGALDEARAWLSTTPVLIPHRFPRTLDSLCGWMYRTAAVIHPCAYVVDYLGRIQAPGHSSYEKTTEASKRLRDVALSTKIPVIAAHQLNRRAGRERDLPQLHDLRDSGQVEQDATEVLMIHRPWDAATIEQRNQGTVDKNEAWLVLRKNRHGENNRKVQMRFSPERSALEVVHVGGEESV